MSFNIEQSYFKMSPHFDFRSAVVEVARAVGYRVDVPGCESGMEMKPYDYGYFMLCNKGTVFSGSTSFRLSEFSKVLGRALKCWCLHLAGYDEYAWGYELSFSGHLCDEFHTAPLAGDLFAEYGDPMEEQERCLAAYRGHPTIIADLFNVPLCRIERYFKAWKFEEGKGGLLQCLESKKAYSQDKWPAGNFFQMEDFAAALGFRFFEKDGIPWSNLDIVHLDLPEAIKNVYDLKFTLSESEVARLQKQLVGSQ